MKFIESDCMMENHNGIIMNGPMKDSLNKIIKTEINGQKITIMYKFIIKV